MNLTHTSKYVCVSTSHSGAGQDPRVTWGQNAAFAVLQIDVDIASVVKTGDSIGTSTKYSCNLSAIFDL
ncbi:hypothetical protein [Candidatus Vallotia cooleyia]|uniref:hypothetical protein n=1 Tax=Candidatus Vallotiella adelgis TaxID=1177211 RepID=UPI001D033541|nr:hypothetical protein [Candidatus Vallotia cooleyia]